MKSMSCLNISRLDKKRSRQSSGEEFMNGKDIYLARKGRHKAKKRSSAGMASSPKE
jgi:hypothetical protein